MSRIEQSAAQIRESMSDAFAALDRDWPYTCVNGAAERATGRASLHAFPRRRRQNRS
jgi:hypothetical protein